MKIKKKMHFIFVSMFQGIESSEQLELYLLTSVMAEFNIPVANFQGAVVLISLLNFDDSEESQVVPFELTITVSVVL